MDVDLARSGEAVGVAQAGASLAPALEAAALVQALPNPASGAPQTVGSIINTFA